LRDPFIDDGLVVLIVLVHSGTPVFALHAALRLRRAKISAFASTVERNLSDPRSFANDKNRYPY
jgi:hypothetical protein